MKLKYLFIIVSTILLSCENNEPQDSLFVLVELKPADPNTQQFINVNIPSGKIIVEVRYTNDNGSGQFQELIMPQGASSFDLPGDFTLTFSDVSSLGNGANISVDIVDETSCVQFCGSASLDTSVVGAKTVVRLEPLGGSSFCSQPQTQSGLDCN